MRSGVGVWGGVEGLRDAEERLIDVEQVSLYGLGLGVVGIVRLQDGLQLAETRRDHGIGWAEQEGDLR